MFWAICWACVLAWTANASGIADCGGGPPEAQRQWLGAKCFAKCTPAPPARPTPARCPPRHPHPLWVRLAAQGRHARPEEAQAGTRAKGGGWGEGHLRMRSHCALRVAVSRDALDRVGRRLANGRSELDAEHLHAAWRA